MLPFCLCQKRIVSLPGFSLVPDFLLCVLLSGYVSPVRIDSFVGDNSLTIVGFVEAADDHPAFGTAGVEKFSMAEIDTNMIDDTSRALSSIEKDQVPKSQFAGTDRFAVSGLIDGLSGEPEIHRRIAEVDQAGAVEAVGTLACIAVALSIGTAQDFLQSSVGRVCVFDDRLIAFC